MPKVSITSPWIPVAKQKGTLEVASQADAINRLKEMGLLPDQGRRGGKAEGEERGQEGFGSCASGRRQEEGVNLNIKIPFTAG